ncbi:hypothetical protein [Vibrio campbellii]|uniref:hypothetical protein n=1 Tax=Vibrio campbellii TaxID=680 RepID=UPI00210C1510|nr:hypothetical protein [Vibrio campbellii]UTZ44793.1 hypothetical protein HB764_26420 [Vibrio campbellii]UTZ44833.1 hypothetical protein HB764_26625 [Vibrio campbellii]
MNEVHLTVEDENWFDKEHVNKCATAALKVARKWLSKESIKRLGQELKISSSAGRRRVKSGKIKGNQTSQWFGLLPLNVAYIRDFNQVPKGVQSGDAFYKGAFVQSMNNSPLLIWKRTRERPTQPKPRRKPLPKGQTRKRKSPPVEVVREDIHMEASEIVAQLKVELQDVYKEAFLDELHQ